MDRVEMKPDCIPGEIFCEMFSKFHLFSRSGRLEDEFPTVFPDFSTVRILWIVETTYSTYVFRTLTKTVEIFLSRLGKTM
jgi:hypothetical protein